MAKGRRRFGAADRAAVVKALAGGASVRAAAKAAGFAVCTLYDGRRRCALFREAWDAAVAESGRPVLVAPRRGRRWQAQRARANFFTRERKEIWLEHFAATCDATAASEAAGISVNTAYAHRRTDPAFRAGWEEALEQGYARLEAEAVAQRIASLERLKVRMREGGDAEAEADAAAEFERVMAVLREFKRAHAGRRGGAAPTKWSFDDAFEALEKELKVFGYRAGREKSEEAPPPPCAHRCSASGCAVAASPGRGSHARSPSPPNGGEDL